LNSANRRTHRHEKPGLGRVFYLKIFCHFGLGHIDSIQIYWLSPAIETEQGELKMYDLAHENAKPGTCGKCRGTGSYSWGAIVNGKASKSGTCFSCRGTGKQSTTQIYRNRTYNRHKIAAIASH